ncbi:L-2-hydroxyglutarate dehydrogenase, mitochondrial [Cydia fagiglandana]|uniref:L-2-hydroxyglutarate dehydrogenase, mitochondrial n=1 Tax=Cydia fagiglandana TaxID=1458189 RepID=UPI002FEDEB69
MSIISKCLFTKGLTSVMGAQNIRSLSNAAKYDVVVIGGGIVGAASARELLIRYPDLKIALLEKEHRFAHHQSGNNSGVIHAGIYYKPGSLKAKLCVEGHSLAYEYCDKKKVPYLKCGKLIVATERAEIPRLLELYDRGQKNGVKDMELMDRKQMKEIEPNCDGLQGIWSPHTGIVSWGEVTRSFVEDFEERGGQKYLNFEVRKFAEAEDSEYPVTISDEKGQEVRAAHVLTCCGLHSDTIAVLTGCPEEPKIVPFRGEYLYIVREKSDLVKANIYPVPDPRFPFLGVHLTPRIDGRIIVGPNAILAFAKEGYKWSDINMKELREILSFQGFRQVATKYAGFGMKEMARSWLMPLQVAQLRKFVLSLSTADVERGPSGVRAQAMGKDGTLIEDFVFDSQAGSGAGAAGRRVLHVRNAPSPGATSSLAIARMVADKMADQFKLSNKTSVEAAL